MIGVLSILALVFLALLTLSLILQHLSRSKVNDIGSKVILITGSDSGFGRAFVDKFSGKECTIFAGCLSQKSIDEIKCICGVNIIPILLDVTNTKHVTDLCDVIEKYLLKHPKKELWGIVNNAGVAGITAPADFLSYGDYRPVMEVNYFGAINITHTFLKQITKSKGRIVNTCSMVSFTNIPYCGPYLASKAAIFAFSESLRREKRVFGVDVSTVCPGAYATNVLDNTTRLLKKCVNKLPDEVRQYYKVTDDSAEADSEYEKITELLGNIQARDLSPVVDSYEHALFSWYPRATYAPGVGGVALRMMSFLPNCVTDLIVTLAFKRIAWWSKDTQVT